MSDVMIKGRRAEVQHHHKDEWRIVSGHDILGRDLEWRHWSTLTCAVFGSQDEAEAFLREHADAKHADPPAKEGSEILGSGGAGRAALAEMRQQADPPASDETYTLADSKAEFREWLWNLFNPWCQPSDAIFDKALELAGKWVQAPVKVAPAVTQPAGEGRELPDEPGVWWRDGGFWLVRESIQTHSGIHAVAILADGWFGAMFDSSELPRGSWHKAAPARPWLTGPEAKTLLADLERQRGTIARLNEQLAASHLAPECPGCGLRGRLPDCTLWCDECVSALREQLAETERERGEFRGGLLKLSKEYAAIREQVSRLEAEWDAAKAIANGATRAAITNASLVTARDEELRRLREVSSHCRSRSEELYAESRDPRLDPEVKQYRIGAADGYANAAKRIDAALATTPAPRMQDALDEVRRILERSVVPDTVENMATQAVEDRLQLLKERDELRRENERLRLRVEVAPPRTLIGDGNPLPPGVWMVRDVFLYALVSDGVHPCASRPGWTYTYVGPVPAEEGK